MTSLLGGFMNLFSESWLCRLFSKQDAMNIFKDVAVLVWREKNLPSKEANEGT